MSDPNMDNPVKPSELENECRELLARGRDLDDKVLQALQKTIDLEITWRLLIGRQYRELDTEHRKLGAAFAAYDKTVDIFSGRVWLHLKAAGNEILLPLHHRRDSINRHLSQFLELLTKRDTQLTARLSTAGTILSVVIAFVALMIAGNQWILMKQQDQETKQTVAKFDERMQSQIGLIEKTNETLTEQVKVLKEQAQVMKTQLEVIEQQVKLERLLRSQKPNLLVEIWRDAHAESQVASGLIALELVIKNVGQKLAEQTFFNIWVPADMKIQSVRPPLGNISEKVQAVVNGKRYTVIRGMQPGSIPPKGPFRLGTIVVEALPGEYVFLWRLSANNEDFPQGDKLGEFAIKLLPSTNEKAQ